MSARQRFAVVFDGPPGHESGRFVEVENAQGASFNAGEWEQSEDGFWRLWIDPRAVLALLEGGAS